MTKKKQGGKKNLLGNMCKLELTSLENKQMGPIKAMQ